MIYKQCISYSYLVLVPTFLRTINNIFCDNGMNLSRCTNGIILDKYYIKTTQIIQLNCFVGCSKNI